MKTLTSVFVLCVGMFICFESSFAQWSTNPAVNNAICTAANYQNTPTIVGDGAGGAIITWNDFPPPGNFGIRAQRINASGIVQWTVNGVAICTAADYQNNPTIVSDGAGGAIITWQDNRSAPYDIYAQRVNASGVVQWTADGVAICTVANSQDSPTILSDGAGGAIITWTDSRTNARDIYAQRINASGVVQWTANGVAICTAAFDQGGQTIVSDGAGGAIISWYDYRSGNTSDIYAQRINASGIVQWTANGVAISTAADYQNNPAIVSDGAGGAIITWTDARNSPSGDIYAQRVSASGTLGASAPSTIALTSGNNQSSQISTALTNPFAVTVRDAGANPVQGTSVTFAIATVPGGATGQSLSVTNATTNINGLASTTLTFGTKSGTYTVTATSGSLTGSPVTFTATAMVGPAATLSLTSGNSQAGQINTALNPFVVTVTDVQSNPVAGVAIAFSLSSAPLNQNGASLSVNSALTNANGQASTSLFLGSKTGSYGVTANAQGLGGSPLLFTATATTGSPSQVVRIGGDNQSGQVNSTLPSPLIAQVTDAGGNPVSGSTISFSVFSAPQGATGQRVSPTSATTDFQGQASTVLTVGNQAGQYRVSATSLGGAFATFNANATVASAVELVESTPTEFSLLQNYPNPFNPSTTIEFSLPRSGYVVLNVFDTFGKEIATLVAENLSAGRYRTKWNGANVASGMYYYRLQAGSFVETRKLMLLK